MTEHKWALLLIARDAMHRQYAAHHLATLDNLQAQVRRYSANMHGATYKLSCLHQATFRSKSEGLKAHA